VMNCFVVRSDTRAHLIETAGSTFRVWGAERESATTREGERERKREREGNRERARGRERDRVRECV